MNPLFAFPRGRVQRVGFLTLLRWQTLPAGSIGCHASASSTGDDKPPSPLSYEYLSALVQDARSPTRGILRGHGDVGLSQASRGYRYRSTLRGWSANVARQARWRDGKKGRQSNIDADHLLDLLLEQEGLCAYSGIAMELLKPNSHWRVSIERIDTQQGYLKGNCCLIAAEFNSSVRCHQAGTSCGSAQWSRQKVQQVTRARTQQVQLHRLQEDIVSARLRPARSQTARFKGFRGPDAAGNWRCARCGNWKQVDQFCKRSSSINGLQYQCKKCDTDSRSAWRQTLRGHVVEMLKNARKSAAHHTFGGSFSLNMDDVLDMLWLQGGRCYYSGVPLHCAAGPADWVWSIERLNNSVTYTRENCVLIAREFQTSDQSRNKAKFPVFGTAQWSTSKVSHIWGPYDPKQNATHGLCRHGSWGEKSTLKTRLSRFRSLSLPNDLTN
ncbi:unnamed protein product [Symbiodinium microadriaticum]|nr:unnamed protein product [Symbiodinium microadriaticum]